MFCKRRRIAMAGAGIILGISVLSGYGVLSSETSNNIDTLGITARADNFYAYLDGSTYTHKINSVSSSSWEDENFKYSIKQLIVTHYDDETEKTVQDVNEYLISIDGYKGTELTLTIPDTVSIPYDLVSSLAKKEIFVSSDKIDIIGASAFKGTNLKSIDLGNIEYIMDNAFASCPYLTVFTIPSTVKYLGDGVFSGSGLKTLNVKTAIMNIPNNFCNSTKLSEINFSYPEVIDTVGRNAFKGTVLTKYPLAGATACSEIGDSAFASCTQLSELVLPDSVYRVDANAFKDCTSLQTLKIGKFTSILDKNCFSGCKSLKTVELNNYLSSIGGGAFSDCSSLVSFPKLPDSLSDWVAYDSSTGVGFGNGVFSGCISLLEINLPSTLTKVPKSTFSGCKALKTVTLGDNITEIQEFAFSNCSNLQSITTNSKIDVVGTKAFSGCSSLRTLVSNSYSVLGDYAYENCSSIVSVSNLEAEECGIGVFSGCTALQTAYLGTTFNSIIPKSMFLGCTSLADVRGKSFNTINLVKAGAFSGCTSLKQINFPAVVILEDSAFKDCSSLIKICDGDIVASDYGNNCFYGCTSLKQNVNMTASTIGKSAFSKSGITSLRITGTSGTTLVIDGNAFSMCANLESVVIDIPSNIECSFGQSLFTGCTSLTSVKYTGTELANMMFSDCTALEEVELPNAKVVTMKCFSGCSSLKQIKGIITFSEIGDSAFFGCKSLMSAYCDKSTVFNGVSQYTGCSSIMSADVCLLTSGMFSDCTKLADISVENNSVIPQKCFYNCSSLVNFDFNGVSSIEQMAFAGTGLSGALKLPSLNEIGKSAFQNCIGLTSLDIEVPVVSVSAFENCTGLSDVIVVANSIDKNAFNGCVGLRKLWLPEMQGYSLSKIVTNAFYNCEMLREVVIPSSVTSIGTKAIGYFAGKTIDDFWVVGVPSSTAEIYADENNLVFVDIGSYNADERELSKKKLGDVNCDGIISIADAVKMQAWVLGKDNGCYTPNMDITGDGNYNVFDLVELKRMIKNLK